MSTSILLENRSEGARTAQAQVAAPLPLVLLPSPDPEPTPEPTPEVTPHPLAGDPLHEAVVGMFSDRPACAVVKRDGETIVAHNPDVPLGTASTQKVLIAAAALQVLGPDHRFRTSVRSFETGEDGHVGHLWIVGGGDPGLSTPEYAAHIAHNARWKDTPPTPLAHLADRMVEAGIRVVHGAIHADETRHDAKRLIGDWQPSTVANGHISPLSSLTVNGGWARFAPWKSAWANPGPDTASELGRLLRERGITVLGGSAVGPVPPDTVELADVHSAPLVQIVTGLLRASDNLATEMVTREIGLKHTGEPTTEAGLRAVRDVLASMGVNVEGFGLRDGSGLSRGNHATCTTLVETVELAPHGVRVGELLAVGGRNGTLYRRFTGTPLEGRILGKTGSITGVTGLTGELGDGRTTYAILQNGVGDPAEARLREEHLVHMISAHP